MSTDYAKFCRYSFYTSVTFYYSESKEKYKASISIRVNAGGSEEYYTGIGRTKLSAYKSAMRKVLIMLENPRRPEGDVNR